MDRRGLYFYLGGAAAMGFYLLLITLFILFFNDIVHPKRYVPKVAQSIEVSIASAPPVRKRPPKPPAPQKKEEPRPKAPAVVKKASSAPKARPSRPKAIASLFEGVKVEEPEESRAARLANAPKIRYRAPTQEERKPAARASELVREINLSKTSIKVSAREGGQGEVDAYLSKLYGILYGSWRPEALYAGSVATVRLDVAPDGSFTYRILRPSDNQGFNESLIEYLDSLQRSGFPPHKRGRNLVIDVEFKAKE